MESRSISDDERIAALEKQLAEAQIIAEDADRRYDEVIFFLFLSSVFWIEFVFYYKKKEHDSVKFLFLIGF